MVIRKHQAAPATPPTTIALHNAENKLNNLRPTILAMSFGVSIARFRASGTMVLERYDAYASGPEPFRNFSQEILSLYIELKIAEDQLHSQGSGNDSLTLSAKATDDLTVLHDGLQAIMKELDALLQDYHSLTENHGISFDRFQEDLSALRAKILTHVGLLTAFNASPMLYVNPHLNSPHILTL